MAIKKTKSESGSRFLRSGAASAPPIRISTDSIPGKANTQLSKENYKYEYFQIDGIDDPVKVMVPNLSASKQNRLQIGKLQRKRALTAGFSRSHSNTSCEQSRVSNYAPLSTETNKRAPLRSSIISLTHSRSNSISFIQKDGKDNSRISIDISNTSSLSDFSSTDSRKPSIVSSKGSSRKKSFASTRMSFNKTMPLCQDSVSPFLEAILEPQEDRLNSRLRKSKLKTILKVLIDPLESKLRQSEEKLADNIARRFKLKGLTMDRKTVERGLLHPPNITKKDTEITKRDDEGLEFIKSGEPGIVYKRKKKELQKRSESTHLLHITALVVEPKDDLHSLRFKDIHKNEDGVAELIKSTVKPKTNTWWTRAEYQVFHDNIADFRKRKQQEKVRFASRCQFLPTGAAFAAISDPFSHHYLNKENVDNIISNKDGLFSRPVWQEGSLNRSLTNGKRAASLFARPPVFQQANGRISRQSHVSSEANSLKFSYDVVQKRYVSRQ